VRPKNLFAMPEAKNEGDMEVHLLDVGIQDNDEDDTTLMMELLHQLW